MHRPQFVHSYVALIGQVQLIERDHYLLLNLHAMHNAYMHTGELRQWSMYRTKFRSSDQLAY
jgi:hypothetical protein